MKKSLVILAIASIAVVSSCKKEPVEQPAPSFKAKSLGDIKEHTGWDQRDSTGTDGDINPNP